jgi:hypothetical protein
MILSVQARRIADPRKVKWMKIFHQASIERRLNPPTGEHDGLEEVFDPAG